VPWEQAWGQDDQMESHDGQRDPDSALILEGIRSLHDRLSELERRTTHFVPGGRADPGGHGVVPA